jgi:hypothetical protein
MTTKRLPRPRDPIQLGKLIVDIATGQVEDRVQDEKAPDAVERGRSGGLKGGHARVEALAPEERRRIARNAANARWSSKKKEPAN